MKNWIVLVVFLALYHFSYAQTGTAFGIKGGMVMANQSWNQSEREFMFGYHGDLFMESVHDSLSLSFYGAVGYHQRGSAQRIRNYFDPIQMRTIPGRKIKQPFNNVTLEIGVKNYHKLKGYSRGFYGLGLRAEYTVAYELAFVTEGIETYLNRFNYGLTVLGGMDFEFPNFPGAIFFEIAFKPDISKQIFIPGNTVTYYNPFTNQTTLYPEQKVFNRSLEITIGYKFIRRVEWVEDSL